MVGILSSNLEGAGGWGLPGLTTCMLFQLEETSNIFLVRDRYDPVVAEWSFLTNHARVLGCIAHDPGVRLRDIATTLGITERTAYGIVTDLTAAGYVVKDKNGRRNRYEIQDHLPMREAAGRERTIGDVLALLVDTTASTSVVGRGHRGDPNGPRPAPTDES